MKLFGLLGVAVADYSYFEMLTAHREGYNLFPVRGGQYEQCPEPNDPVNADLNCYANKCVSMCDPAFFTIGPKQKSVCRGSPKRGYSWNVQPPSCETCDITQIPGHSGMDSFCSVNPDNNRMECDVRCKDDSRIFGQKERRLACKCHNDWGCEWFFTGPGMRRLKDHAVDMDQLETMCPKPDGDDVVDNTCPANYKKTKDDHCTVVTMDTTLLNTWTCRDCHRLRVYFNLKKDYKIKNWSSHDSLYIKFSAPIKFIKHQHPVKEAYHIGDNEWRFRFSSLKEWTDQNMDFTSEFRPAPGYSGPEPEIISSRTCPCTITVVST